MQNFSVTNKEGLLIRRTMSTLTKFNIVGKLEDGDPFIVYQLFPRGKDVWARVSNNPKDLERYVCIKLGEKQMAEPAEAPDDVDADRAWMLALDRWARGLGYNGPGPGRAGE